MSQELGTLVVVVLKARNLNDKHSFYKQDAFAQISLGSGPKKRTAVDVKGGQHPVWDEEIRISVPKDSSEKNRTLEASCWAKEHKADDLLGQGKVDITETLKTGEFDGTCFHNITHTKNILIFRFRLDQTRNRWGVSRGNIPRNDILRQCPSTPRSTSIETQA